MTSIAAVYTCIPNRNSQLLAAIDSGFNRGIHHRLTGFVVALEPVMCKKGYGSEDNNTFEPTGTRSAKDKSNIVFQSHLDDEQVGKRREEIRHAKKTPTKQTKKPTD